MLFWFYRNSDVVLATAYADVLVAAALVVGYHVVAAGLHFVNGQEIRRLNPHKARHTFSTLLHRAGVDMDTRQKLLGHSDVATTMHYTHPDVETLRRGIAQINILKAK